MKYAKRAKISILMPLFMIPIFVIAVGLTYVGYKMTGNDNPLYVIGILVALLIGFLGGLVWLVCEIISIINSILARKNNSSVPIGFKILLLVEFVLTVLWLYGAWSAFMRSMSV